MSQINKNLERTLVSYTEPGATPYRTGVTQGGDAYVNVPIEPAPG